jgi:multiple sugar transport system ATP-binding protein
VGTPLELYYRPDNEFVARFIGTPSMNLMTLAVGSDGRLTGPGIDAPPPPLFARALRDYGGRTVRAGIRPEQVGDPAVHAWTRTATVRAPVDIVETVGHEVIVHLRVGEGMLIGRLDARRIPRLGDTLELALNVDAMHLFDPATGVRLSQD